MKQPDYFNTDPRVLASQIGEAEQELLRMRAALEAKRRMCQHKWSEPRYTPDITPARTDPGDPPGTMGVDWRGPTYVPRQEKPKWTRNCPECGAVEETTQTRDAVRKIPVFK